MFYEKSGSYNEASGMELIRKDIALFIEKRDNGLVSLPENIFLANGASNSITVIFGLSLKISTLNIFFSRNFSP